MSKVSDNILKRVYILMGAIVLFAVLILVKVGYIMFVQGEKWRTEMEESRLIERKIPATRGSILADDLTELAHSQPFYMLSIDPKLVDTTAYYNFRASLDTLCRKLDAHFENPTYNYEYFFDRIMTGIREEDRHIYIHPKEVDYKDYEEMRTWPILRAKKNAGGLIGEERNNMRYYPYGDLARITLGVLDRDHDTIPLKGLEYAFHKALRGEDRTVLMRKVAAGAYVPVDEYGDVDAHHGQKVVTTLNINIQEAAEHALKKAVKENEAKWGVAVVMEVGTGDLKAVANYPENINRAAARLVEPGSTFKLASAMMLLDDGYVHPGDTIDTGKGFEQFYDMTIRDHIGLGKITFREAFEKSSNVAFARLINKHYKDRLDRYFSHLEKYGLMDKVGLQLAGEPEPDFHNPNEGDPWSGTTLPSMAIGYSERLTAIQLVTFYNAVANNGRVMQPRLVSEIREGSRVMEKYEPQTLRRQICSPQTLRWLREMMVGVVEKGTARSIKGTDYPIAGKTGTAKKVIDGQYQNIYQASFAGYYPADKPKYTIYILIDEPSAGEIYGGSVAAPVFREIADQIYSLDLEMAPTPESLAPEGEIAVPVGPVLDHGNAAGFYEHLDIPVPGGSEAQGAFIVPSRSGKGVEFTPMALKPGKVPSVKGMSAKDALALLEGLGLHVELFGHGRVSEQSMDPGENLVKGKTIVLRLAP